MISPIGKVAFVVPAHNEEAVIVDTLKSLLKIVDHRDIYVVNDGSKDNTAFLARRYTNNLLNLNPNQGKANALNSAISHFKLPERYEYIMPIDADTQVDEEFLNHALPVLESDKDQEYACVVGKVVGLNVNYITAYRVWEYEIAQSVHKAAQAIENAIIVCPGPSTLYRSTVFQKLTIPTETLTEDMDFTFMIHRHNLGKIAFQPKAQVITQDPNNLKAYLKQIDRWYTGFWQCIKKHNMPWGGQNLDFEIALLASEGLFNGLLPIISMLAFPFILFSNPAVLLIPFLVDLGLFILPTLYYTAKVKKDFSIFKYLPHFYLIRTLASLMFIKGFMKVVLGFNFNIGWNTARYTVRKEAKWALR